MFLLQVKVNILFMDILFIRFLKLLVKDVYTAIYLGL